MSPAEQSSLLDHLISPENKTMHTTVTTNEQAQVEANLVMAAFIEFATRKQMAADLLYREKDRFQNQTTQLIFDAFREGQARITGQQLYAGILESSKYYSQIQMCLSQGYGHPFPIKLQPSTDGYVVVGGVGRRYRMKDVELFVLMDGKHTHVA